MNKKEVTHRATATRLAGANAAVIIALILLGDVALTEFNLLNGLNHARFWYYAICAAIMFGVVIYYEMAYQSELYET